LLDSKLKKEEKQPKFAKKIGVVLLSDENTQQHHSTAKLNLFPRLPTAMG
jgi:hypothetical protein